MMHHSCAVMAAIPRDDAGRLGADERGFGQLLHILGDGTRAAADGAADGLVARMAGVLIFSGVTVFEPQQEPVDRDGAHAQAEVVDFVRHGEAVAVRVGCVVD